MRVKEILGLAAAELAVFTWFLQGSWIMEELVVAAVLSFSLRRVPDNTQTMDRLA